MWVIFGSTGSFWVLLLACIFSKIRLISKYLSMSKWISEREVEKEETYHLFPKCLHQEELCQAKLTSQELNPGLPSCVVWIHLLNSHLQVPRMYLSGKLGRKWRKKTESRHSNVRCKHSKQYFEHYAKRRHFTISFVFNLCCLTQ